jgi:hypothetical protein
VSAVAVAIRFAQASTPTKPLARIWPGLGLERASLLLVVLQTPPGPLPFVLPIVEVRRTSTALGWLEPLIQEAGHLWMPHPEAWQIELRPDGDAVPVARSRPGKSCEQLLRCRPRQRAIRRDSSGPPPLRTKH